jgi:hypothetical protein
VGATSTGSIFCFADYLLAPIREKYGLSERHACRMVGQHRGTQRYATIVRADEDALTRAIISLASQYGRYGYRRITALLCRRVASGL